MAAGHRWQNLGDEYLRLFVATYQNDGKVHWPTLVSSLGALSGEALLLSGAVEMPESGVIESERVSELMYSAESPAGSVYGYGALLAEHAFNVKPETLFSYEDALKRVGHTLLPGHFPDFDIPINLAPRETPLFAGQRNRRAVNRIAAQRNANSQDQAFAMMTAAMKAVGFAEKVWIPHLTNLTLQSAVAGSRFVPLLQLPRIPTEHHISDLFEIMQGGAGIEPPEASRRSADETGTAANKLQRAPGLDSGA